MNFQDILIYGLFSNTKGVLYTLVEEIYEGYFSSFPVCDSDFDSTISESLLPFWISLDHKENLTSLIIKNQYHNDFIIIIDLLIDTSIHKRILFHTRYKFRNSEIVLGVLKFSQFKDMLNKNKIVVFAKEEL